MMTGASKRKRATLRNKIKKSSDFRLHRQTKHSSWSSRQSMKLKLKAKAEWNNNWEVNFVPSFSKLRDFLLCTCFLCCVNLNWAESFAVLLLRRWNELKEEKKTFNWFFACKQWQNNWILSLCDHQFQFESFSFAD